jgi:uncharacterized pyridoxal phosphate-dependent enzyme
LRRVINAWGTPTPFGVSRSAPEVGAAMADMLGRYVVMADLQAVAGASVAAWAGSEAACITHCTASAVTLAVAACMAGSDAACIQRLPAHDGMPYRVPLLAQHAIHYGQPVTQAIRLAGAEPVPCASLAEVEVALSQPGVAAVLAVDSHLAPGSGPAVTLQLLACARAAGVPLVLDAAAQDRRAPELVGLGADLVLVSAQKYLGGPTAGLVLGSGRLVRAVEAQHTGIGRGMKPSKEAIAGVLAALSLRQAESPGAWLAQQRRKVDAVASTAAGWAGVRVDREADPQGNGFDRLWLAIDSTVTGVDAAGVVARLRDGNVVVAVAPHRVAQGRIGLELTGVADGEVDELCRLLAAAFGR